MTRLFQLSDASFEADVINADSPVLVDFWPNGKGPCKMIARILNEVAQNMKVATVAKLNIDHNADTPPKYGIRGIPTLLLFKNGEVAATKVGAPSKTQLKEFLDGNLYYQEGAHCNNVLVFYHPDAHPDWC